MNNQIQIDRLLLAARQGDLNAENQLFYSLQKMIFKSVSGKLSFFEYYKDKSEIKKDAEDLTEDICLIIFEKYKFENFHHGFLPWVFKIAKYKVGDYFRKCAFYNKTFERLEHAKAQDVTFPRNEELDKRIANLELKNAILNSLRLMEPAIQTIIKAIWEDKIKDYILQQKVTIPRNTIYSRISRSKCYFKKALFLNGICAFI